MNRFSVNVIAIALGATLCSMLGVADAAGAQPRPRSERGQLAHRVVMKWGGHVQEAYGANVRDWAMEMVPLFAHVPIQTLREAAKAGNFEAMNDALLVDRGSSSSRTSIQTASEAAAAKLGDADNHLVFVPITPCRIIDTRLAGGPIATGTVRSFDVTAVSSYAFQGGSSTNCGGAGAAGSFAAAAINFTVVNNPQAGHMTVFPFGAAQPDSAALNWPANDVRGNFGIYKLDQGASANELSIYVTRSTDVVADLVGYFINPAQPTMECISSGKNSFTLSAGGTHNTAAPACLPGYAVTATNCESSSWQMPFVYVSGGICSAQNNSSGDATLSASTTCCRVVF